jgi:hypothetical protein
MGWASHRMSAENKKCVQNFGLGTFIRVVTQKFKRVEGQYYIILKKICYKDLIDLTGYETMLHLWGILLEG